MVCKPTSSTTSSQLPPSEILRCIYLRPHYNPRDVLAIEPPNGLTSTPAGINYPCMPGGRPSEYTAEVADAICEAIATEGALYRLCAQRDDFPAERTVYQWLERYPEFAQNYARARERQADRRNDEIVVIADEATDANLARLQIDARKWQASKLAPKKYGDKLALGGLDGGPLQVQVVKFTDDEA